MIRSAVWLAPLASPAELFKGLLRRSVAESRLVPARLPADERSALERLVNAPNDEFGAADAAAILALAAKIDDFWGLYWTDRAAMARHLAWFEERPFAPVAFLEIVTDLFGLTPNRWPSYDGIPALMLYDPGDRVAPWLEQGAKLAAHIPHARTQVVNNGYHWLQFQQPDACVASTLAFWNEVS
jgi:pimeloyl-ACP methyl ester carboxylesterase